MNPTPATIPARAAHTSDRPRALFPSAHARQKMTDRAVTWAEVVDVVERAELTEPHGGHRRYCRAGLCVVVAENGCVVTILMRRTDPWTDADVRARTA